jgi:hypothetical protein
MTNAPELNKNCSTVKVFVNNKYLLQKFFRKRDERNKWMRDMAIHLGGRDIYFDLHHQYMQRSEAKYKYAERYREQKKKERFKAEYSNEQYA